MYEKQGKSREFVLYVKSEKHHNDTGDELTYWKLDNNCKNYLHEDQNVYFQIGILIIVKIQIIFINLNNKCPLYIKLHRLTSS